MEYAEKARTYFLQNVFDKQIVIESYGVHLELEDYEVIPYEKRVHLTVVERNDEDIDRITPRVKECREMIELLWF